MEFKRYSSIENSYRKKTLDEIYARGFDKEDWVVTEKVHGSNFSLWMDNEGLRCAKRSGFLAVGDKFFNWEKVIEAYDAHISVLYKVCTSLFHDLVEEGYIEMSDDKIEVVLFGEIFGGLYDHPDVEKADVKKVQKGVQYCPWVDFYAFDLKINGIFMNYNIFSEIMESVGFHYAKEVYRGPLSNCLQCPNDLPTTLPARFGLPEIKDNISEGVVIKPVNSRFFGSGGRVVLKNKNDKFKEKESSKKVKTPKPAVVLTDVEMEILACAGECTTENRLRNVISQIGEIDQKMFGKLLGAFCKDILEEVQNESPALFDGLEKDRVKIINKAVNKDVQEFLRERFLDVIDGTF